MIVNWNENTDKVRKGPTKGLLLWQLLFSWWPLTPWPQNVKVHFSHHPASMYEIWKPYIENCSSYRVRTKVLKVTLWPWPLDPKMYRYLPLTILHLCIKYESCTLKTNQVIVSEPKCWQSSVVTLTFELLTLKFIGIFLSPSCIYVWNMKAVSWKLLKLSCQKTTQVIVSEPKYWQSSIVTLTFDLLTPKCIGIFLSPSCIYVWNMKAVRWKLLKLSCQNQSVDRQTDRQTDWRTDKPDSYRAPA